VTDQTDGPRRGGDPSEQPTRASWEMPPPAPEGDREREEPIVHDEPEYRASEEEQR
jgi:hypothetical protein